MRSRTKLVGAFLAAGTALFAIVFAPHAVAVPSVPGTDTKDGLIWLPNFGAGSVQAVDPVAGKVVETIPDVADHPINAKVNADGTLLFVNSFGPTVWNVNVVDLRSRTVIERIPTTGPAWATTAMSHDYRHLYVPTALGTIDVIDTTTLAVVRSLPTTFPPGGPVHLEVSKDDRSLYVMHIAGFVTKYDAVTGAIQAPPLFLYGIGPGWGALTESGDTLYAVNAEAGITAIDTKGWYVKRTMFEGVFSQPLTATIAPNGKDLWVCNFSDNTLLVLDADTFELKRKLHPDGTPIYVGFAADGKTAYLSNLGTAYNGVPDFLGFTKLGVAYAPQLNPQGSTLDVYDTDTYAVTDRIPTASAPMAGVYPG